MRLAEYEAVRAAVEGPCHVYPDMDAVLAAHPGLSLDALVSIHAQEAARRVRAQHAGHRRAARSYADRYARGTDVLALSAQVDLPPCLLMRLILEALLGLPHKAISSALRDPSRLPPPLPPPAPPPPVPHARLVADIQRAVAWDRVCSPLVEALKAAAGAEYEGVLEARLQALRIPFATEADLRAGGFARTPDVRLEAPIAVRGRIVHWIDSKASFADPLVHREKGIPQFQAYVNRYGPGLVIYWLGYPEELGSSHPDVALADAFPDEADIQRLPALPLPLLQQPPRAAPAAPVAAPPAEAAG